MRNVEAGVLAFLLNATWQIALIAAAAAVASRLLKRSPAFLRHTAWVVALAAALLLPASQIARNYRTTASYSHEVSSAPISLTGAPLPTSIGHESGINADALPAIGIPAAPAPLRKSRDLRVGRTLALAVVSMYAAMVLWRIVALFSAWLRARRLARRARFVTMDARLRRVIDACTAAFGGVSVALYSSQEISAPATIGWLHPQILFPAELLERADEESLVAAIAHEAAHIARRDYLLNLICEILYVPLAFHFAAALVRRQIRRTRELSCDEMVTRHVLSADRYARALIELASSAIPRPAVTLAVGVNDGEILEERIVATLRRPKMNSRSRSFTIAAAAAAFLIPCAAAMPFAVKVGIKADAQSKVETAGDASVSKNSLIDPAVSAATASAPAPNQPASSTKQNAGGDSRIEGQYASSAREPGSEDVRDRGYAVQENSQAENEARERRLQELQVKLEQAKQAVEQDEESGVSADQDRAAVKILEKQLMEVRGQSENYKVQLERLQQTVAEMEAKLANDQQSGANTEQDQKTLQELKEKLAAAQSGRVEVEPGRVYLNPEGESKETVEKLQRLEAQLAQALQLYSPEHPAVKQLQAQVAEVKQQLEQQNVGWKRRSEEEMKQRQVELAGKAKISMSDAIQIALQAHPGSVMECALRGERDMVFYNVGIFGDASVTTKDASGKAVTNTVKTEFNVLVDATDGHIVKPGEWRKNEQ